LLVRVLLEPGEEEEPEDEEEEREREPERECFIRNYPQRVV
jgi:hypothetical protein